MINLLIDEYCENCPDFEPEVDKTELYNDMGDVIHGMGDAIHNTEISCAHRERCRSIKDYLEATVTVDKAKGEKDVTC